MATFKAKSFSYTGARRDRVLGEFPTMFDAKIACERHAKQPLRWIDFDAREFGPYSAADISEHGALKRVYSVSAAVESEAAE
jgi:hypothetical protein